MDYRFGNKNNWRRWLWNRISERLSVPSRRAIVYYLAGEQDLDRPVALRHGFKDRNLIAIDRSDDVVARLREEGRLAVAGDFIACLVAAPPSLVPDVILFDTCSGLEARDVIELANALIDVRYEHAVVAVNFMRGRDPSTNRLREQVSKWVRNGHVEEHVKKNRAMLAYLCVCAEWASRLYMVIMSQRGGVAMSIEEERALSDSMDDMMELNVPEFASYRSSAGMYFDSGVWRVGVPLFSETRLVEKKHERTFRGRLTAVSAVRSRKMLDH